MESQVTRIEIEKLVTYSVKHSSAEAIASFPMFKTEIITQLYSLTEKQRSDLSWHLVYRNPASHQTDAVPTPVYPVNLDALESSPAWDIIVKLYEESEEL